jgi:hemolysin III
MGDAVAVKPLLRGWSHVVSFVAVGIIGVFMMAYTEGPPRDRLTLAVYLIGTLAMFGVSALYHRGAWTDATREIWKRLDHSTIFLAIAGAYTPICVACLDDWHRNAVLIAAWGGAVVGITLQWLPVHVPRPLFTIVYVVVGWSMLLALPQLFHGIGALGFSLVLAGGVAYTAGAVIYAIKRPDPWPRVFGFHEVFHLLTVIGAGLHLAAIAFVVVPKL